MAAIHAKCPSIHNSIWTTEISHEKSNIHHSPRIVDPFFYNFWVAAFIGSSLKFPQNFWSMFWIFDCHFSRVYWKKRQIFNSYWTGDQVSWIWPILNKCNVSEVIWKEMQSTWESKNAPSEESLFLFLFDNSTLGGVLTFHSGFPIYMHELILREVREG